MKMQGECCGNCGFVEREHPRRKNTKMYCTNCDSEHCSEWVNASDTCSKWILLTETTKYYNIATDRGC